MYYSRGNYEAFVRPEKPAGVDRKSAYLVGAGLASLAAAAFMIRDGQMKGERIHILEGWGRPGGACDGFNDPKRGYVIRGGTKEIDTKHECMWDLYSSIPSLEIEGASVLDEFYRLSMHDPNASLCRATVNRGEDAHTDNQFALSDKAALEILDLFMTRDEDLYDKKIDEVFTDEVLLSNFWLYWRTMFAFENWHSALEMKLYVQRFIHGVGGMPDLSCLKFFKYNIYDSFIMPLVKYLEKHNVDFQYNVKVSNVIFDIKGGKKAAKQILCKRNGKDETIDLTENDLVFVTNGSNVDNSTFGDDTHAAGIDRTQGISWQLWKNIAAQDPSFGRPEKFCSDTNATNWESATITTLDARIPKYIQKICKRDPFSGKGVSGGIVSIKDSNWLISWTVNRQPRFKDQPKDQIVFWLYGLFTDVPGNYIKKSMMDCTGTEIVEEFLYHMGVPEAEIHDMASTGAHCIPSMMPYVTAFFMPRTKGDRPDVIPEGCVNFAFLGQFAETPRDTIFTLEYSIRTAMVAVYTLLDIQRGVPEPYNSVYDIRDLLNGTSKILDGRKPLEVVLPALLGVVGSVKAKMDKNVVVALLKKYNNI